MRSRSGSRRAVQEPVDLAPASEKDPAQHEAEAAPRMRLAIGQRQRRSPGTAEHQPALDRQMFPQPLDIRDQVRGGVVAQLRPGNRAAGAALIEQDDAVAVGIEEPTVDRGASRARTAMQEDDGNAVRIAALLPVHRMDGVEPQHAAAIRFDRRKELPFGHRVPRVGDQSSRCRPTGNTTGRPTSLASEAYRVRDRGRRGWSSPPRRRSGVPFPSGKPSRPCACPGRTHRRRRR